MIILKTNRIRRKKYDEQQKCCQYILGVRPVRIKEKALEGKYKLSMIVNGRTFEELSTTSPSKKEKSELQRKDKKMNSKMNNIFKCRRKVELW